MGNRNRAYHGTQRKQPSERELKHGRLARNLASEGMVLLKNEGLLPLKEGTSVALFGSGASHTVRGGTGSGDVNNRESISIYKGLKDAGVTVTSERWLADYQKHYETARNIWKEKILEDAKGAGNPFEAYAANPFFFPEGSKITAGDVEGASVGIYVLSRVAGEGKDRHKTEGDYYLSAKEQEDILYLNQIKIPIVLILNVGAPVELTELLQKAENIRAILYISLPGQEGGYAAADVLFGRTAPGGRLTTTWAKHYEDYPYAEDFGRLNGNLDNEKYKEGIYVGYRYFESFGIQPLFPFGYGLSYTDFSIKFEGIQITESGIEVSVTVKNVGECYSGREVVQVYVTLPQTGIAKEYKRLAGFAKTDVLLPDQLQKVIINIEAKQFASFSETECAWIIESGKYGIWVGEHMASLQLEALLDVPEQILLEQVKEICPQKVSFKELDAPEHAKKKAEEWLAMAEEKKVPVFPFVPRKEKKRKYEMPLAMEQSIEELIPLLYGNVMPDAGILGATGTVVPGSAGETTDALEEKYGVRSLIMADGPAGLRLRQSYEVERETGTVCPISVLGVLENGFLVEKEQREDADTYYQFCTAFPVGTALAQTWDMALVQEFGKAVAVEMEEMHIDLWLAPGMNIHRNPLCGRNFEYYSEDPLLSGFMAAAVTNGVQNSGKCGVTIKHFACNNQEDNRRGVDVCVSQRALREIYLRGFEIAVKTSSPAAIMSAYNCINGIHAANSYDICTTVLREEWGFEGIVMTDWGTTDEGGSVSWQCAASGNDLIMPGCGIDDEDIRRAYAQGELSEKEIRLCAGRILALVQRLSDEG